VDIEGIVKDFGITPKLRRVRKCIDGQWPIDPYFIFIQESYAAHPALYRSDLAGDFCRILLAYDVSVSGKIPNNLPHRTLATDEYLVINRDAQYLAGAILFPTDLFVQKWKECLANAPEKGSREELVHYCTGILESTFCSHENHITCRATDLELMTGEELRKYFT
jgi:hypothetical protein